MGRIVVALALAWGSLAWAWAQAASIDFRNRIPGLLDAPVFDVDGVTPLSERFAAQVYTSPIDDSSSYLPTGVPAYFQTGTNAGYWIPNESILIGVTLGETIFVKVVAFEVFAFGGLEVKYGIRGESRPLAMVVTNSLMPLIGLESFSLQPESLGARRAAEEVVIYWTNLGASDYELEATSSLEAPVRWDTIFDFVSTGGPRFGEEISVTNSVAGGHRYFRLRRFR